MPKGICSISDPDCQKPQYARGWCGMHYMRWLKHGDPLVTKLIRGDDQARFESKVDRSGGPDACHLWLAGQRNEDGYGDFWFHGRSRTAHSVAWEMAHGPVPPGAVLDHECHNEALKAGTCHHGACLHRLCCNERHLALTTNHKNLTSAGWAKLTATQVAEIRELLNAGGLSQKLIGARYNVNETMISAIKTGKAWRQP